MAWKSQLFVTFLIFAPHKYSRLFAYLRTSLIVLLCPGVLQSIALYCLSVCLSVGVYVCKSRSACVSHKLGLHYTLHEIDCACNLCAVAVARSSSVQLAAWRSG